MFNAEANFVASNLNDGDDDVVADDDALAYLAGNDDHDLLSVSMQRMKSRVGTTASVQAAENGLDVHCFRSDDPNKVSRGPRMSSPSVVTGSEGMILGPTGEESLGRFGVVVATPMGPARRLVGLSGRACRSGE